MRRSRLKIIPNLSISHRGASKAPIVAVGQKPDEVVEVGGLSPPFSGRDLSPPPLTVRLLPPKVPTPHASPSPSTEKENEVSVPLSELDHPRQRPSYPKGRPMPNLAVSRKRTLSSSSTGSSRTRTLSGASTLTEGPIELPVFDQRKAEHKKRFNKGVPERSKMTVFDFIFHNPSEGAKMNIPDSSRVIQESIRDSLSDKEQEEEEEEEQEQQQQQEQEVDSQRDEEVVSAEDTHMPAPQVKIGPDGQIIIDEDSTVIETTATKKAKEDMRRSSLVYENQTANYGTWAKKRKNVDWTKKETLRFYKALNVFGTDFSMMASAFKKRDRYDLKIKFKKEERFNRTLVDRCLSQSGQFDPSSIGSESEEDEETLAKRKKRGAYYASRRKLDTKDKPTKRKGHGTKLLRQSRGYYASSSEAEEDSPEIPPFLQSPSPATTAALPQDEDNRSTESPVLVIDEQPPDNTFPPGLLAANPGLANATSGSLVVVAAPSTPDTNSNLHVYMVDKNEGSKPTRGRVRTLSSSGILEPPSPKQSSSSNENDKNGSTT